MSKKNMRKNSLMEYKAVIFDLDGTLYYQKPFRIRMMCYLMTHIITHPSSIKDIFLIKKYREIREDWETYEKQMAFDKALSLDDRQYEYVARKKGVSAKQVKNAVEFFMLEAPLSLLPSYKDEMLGEIIDKLRAEGIKIIVYSDYPVENKLAALKIKADACFTSADKDIGCMKPDPKGLAHILKSMNLDKASAIMIGDRYDKDGLAAIGNEMDYVILESSKKEREKTISELI